MNHRDNFTLLVILALSFYATSGYLPAVNSPYHIFDIWGTTSQWEVIDGFAHQWRTVGFLNSSSETSACSGYVYLGGPGRIASSGLMERTWTGFSSHNILYFDFGIALSGNWQASDSFSIQFDGRVLSTFTPFLAVSNQGSSPCGASNVASVISYVVGKVFHTQSTMTFTFTWDFQGTGSPSVGIKDFSASFAMKTAADAEEAKLVLGNTSYPYSTSCTIGKYFNTTSNSCRGCAGACWSCFGPTASQCYRPVWNGFYDGSAAKTCAANCNNCYGTASNECYRCSTTTTLNPNGTCQTSCPSPLEQFGDYIVHKCIQPCASNQYMLWNETCADSCNYPFIPGVDSSSRKTCDFPCAMSVNSFLYENGSCLSTCPSPYIQISQNNYQYCNFPCSTSGFPYQNASRPLTTSQNDDDENTVISTLAAINNAAALGVNVLRMSNPHSALMTALAKIVKYVKNLDVPILDPVRKELNSQAASPFFSISLTFTIEMPAKLEQCFKKRPLPHIFSESNFHSSFFVNHWESMSTYFILFALGCVISFLEKLIQKHWSEKRILVAIFKRLKVISRWNFVLFALFNTYDDLTFFPILEFMTLEFDSAASKISFYSCLIMMSIAILMLVKVFVISKDIIKTKRQIRDVTNIKNSKRLLYEKWENYQVLHAGYKDNTFFTQSFLLFSTTRIVVCYLIVGLLYKHPLAQAVQITSMNLVMIVYILKLRPIRDPLNFFITMTYETLALMVNICVLILAISNELNTLSTHAQHQLSYTILALNTAINTFSSIVTWVYVINGAWSAYKASKEFGLSGITTWLNVPLASYQNPAMDFDEHSHNLAVEPRSLENKDIKESKQEIGPASQHTLRRHSTFRRVNAGDSDVESPFSGGRFIRNSRFTIHGSPDQSSIAPDIKSNFGKLDYRKLFFNDDNEKFTSNILIRPRYSRDPLSYSTNIEDVPASSRNLNRIPGKKYGSFRENNNSLASKNLFQAEKEDESLRLPKISSIEEFQKDFSRSNFDDQLLFQTPIRNSTSRFSRFMDQSKGYAVKGPKEPIKIIEKIESNVVEAKDKEVQDLNGHIADLSLNVESIKTTRTSRKLSYRRNNYDDESRSKQGNSRAQMYDRMQKNTLNQQDIQSYLSEMK